MEMQIKTNTQVEKQNLVGGFSSLLFFVYHFLHSTSPYVIGKHILDNFPHLLWRLFSCAAALPTDRTGRNGLLLYAVHACGAGCFVCFDMGT